MDAAGTEQAALFGISEGGPLCMMFAATYPARTSALVLYGTYARMLRAPDYPIGMPVEALGKFLDKVEESWGTGALSADLFAPSLAKDEAFRQSWGRFERLAVSPSGMKALASHAPRERCAAHASVIRVPTLIVQRDGDRVSRVEGGSIHRRTHSGREVRGAARPRPLPVGRRHATPSSTRSRSSSPAPGTARSPIGSWPRSCSPTSSAPPSGRSTLGDRRWRDLLDRHHAWSASSSPGFAAARSTPRATDSWPPSTGRPAASGAPARSCARCAGLDLEIRAGLHTGECEVLGRQAERHRGPHRRARRIAGRRGRGARVEHREGPGGRLRNHVRRPRRPESSRGFLVSGISMPSRPHRPTCLAHDAAHLGSCCRRCSRSGCLSTFRASARCAIASRATWGSSSDWGDRPAMPLAPCRASTKSLP